MDEILLTLAIFVYGGLQTWIHRRNKQQVDKIKGRNKQLIEAVHSHSQHIISTIEEKKSNSNASVSDYKTPEELKIENE